jgi:nicotinamidase-related amidase
VSCWFASTNTTIRPVHFARRPRQGERLVTKNGLDAFDGTDLDEYMRGLGVETVVVAGLSTAHGISATAATARERGYDVVVAGYATASVTEAEHHAALDRLAALGARIATAEDVVV